MNKIDFICLTEKENIEAKDVKYSMLVTKELSNENVKSISDLNSKTINKLFKLANLYRKRSKRLESV